MLAEPSVAELEAHFARARATAKMGSPAAGAMTLLHIGGSRTEVLSGRGESPDTRHTLGIGAEQIARTYFHHDPPTSIEIERSIDAVEDEVMRLSHQIDPQAALVGIDDGLRAWAAIAGTAMTLELVEQLFQRLASASLGRPSALEGLLTGREAAATLLILREFMHHLGYASIMVLALPRDATQP